MQIGTVAKRIGLSVGTIRFYERSALLPLAPRTNGGFRRYGNSDVETSADGPHHPRVVQELRKVLLAQSILEEIQEVAVRNSSAARDFKFRGSPTMRINARDVAGESEEHELYALACRLYPGAQDAGVPPVEMIRRAVLKVRAGERV